MLKDETIVSVDWLKPGELWVCDTCEVIPALARILVTDRDKSLFVRYQTKYATHSEDQFSPLYPQDPYYTKTLMFAFIHSVRSDVGDVNGFVSDLKHASNHGLDVPEEVFTAIDHLLEGKSYDIIINEYHGTARYTPVGKWITKDSQDEKYIWEGVDWYYIEDVVVKYIHT